MTIYGDIAAKKPTQQEQARPDQVKNNAGGFVFSLDKWKRLDRFLILGADQPTYYVDQSKLAKDNIGIVRECLADDGAKTVGRIVEVSDQGRAPKNDPAIFVLACAAADANPATRHAALAALPKVCRIGTHLFHFAEDVSKMRRWGRGLRTAIARWYTERSIEKLAVQLGKYQQRDGWSHRDLLRLSHPKAPTPQHDAAFRWAVGGGVGALDKSTMKNKEPWGNPLARTSLPAFLEAMETARTTTSVDELVKLIRTHELPHECVPNEHKNDPRVWEAMLPSMGLTALLRNLGKLASVGLTKPMSEATKLVAQKLDDEKGLRSARVHPMAVLIASGIYAQGHGDKGKLSWSADREIIDAIDAAFYKSFAAVVPSNKRTLIALDVSGSMGSAMLAGAGRLSAREASAAMALVTMRSEPWTHVVGFASNGTVEGLTILDISPRQRLGDVVKTISGIPFGGTDCALPMLYATHEKIDVDTFIVYTDSETWAGTVHPYQALMDYCAKRGRAAKLVVVGMTSTGFSIAPQDSDGCLDVVGFDASAPTVIADFARH